jgi:hypothetical protein
MWQSNKVEQIITVPKNFRENLPTDFDVVIKLLLLPTPSKWSDAISQNCYCIQNKTVFDIISENCFARKIDLLLMGWAEGGGRGG